jgi:hypothetical protein
MATAEKHRWQFAARFRRNAFSWRSQLAIQRVREAVAEIKKVRRSDSVLAAEGAVLFLEKVSPALEHVDSSSRCDWQRRQPGHRGTRPGHRDSAG